MSRNISSDLKAHFEGGNLTLATCWKITRTDNTVMGFTDHDGDLLYESVNYKAATGFEPTDVQQRDDMSVDNMDVTGILNDSAITEADIQAGLYDYSEIEIFMINYRDLTQGRMVLKRGWIGEVNVKRGQFVAEIRGLAQKLSQNIGRIYSPSCDAVLGDEKCGVDVSGFTSSVVTVTNVTSNQLFATNGGVTLSTYFKGGEVTWISGGNSGAKMEVKEFSTDAIMELVLPMSRNVSVGDTFTVIAGCDKSGTTCQSKFNNYLNFRGFPDLPGQDKIYETSGTFR